MTMWISSRYSNYLPSSLNIVGELHVRDFQHWISSFTIIYQFWFSNFLVGGMIVTVSWHNHDSLGSISRPVNNCIPDWAFIRPYSIFLPTAGFVMNCNKPELLYVDCPLWNIKLFQLKLSDWINEMETDSKDTTDGHFCHFVIFIGSAVDTTCEWARPPCKLVIGQQ